MSLALTVHRGTQAIGGSCIELEGPTGERLILDAGRPLDADRQATGLLPTTLDLHRPATVIFSHSHMDHWGLIDELPANWPIWSGEKAAELMRLSAELFGGGIERPFKTWNSRSGPFQIGGFQVTPYLTDHSAPDAYMLLIEGWGRRVLYTGDFRAHGRKARLVEDMIAAPPRRIDVLIMEGTNLGTDKPVISESDLEDAFVELARETPRHVFVSWSAQNVDRTVTLFRAARRTGRQFVVDLYGADVLQRIAEGTALPAPGPNFPELKVVITPGGKRLYARQGRHEFVTQSAESEFATSRARLRNGRAIIMLRDSMLEDFAQGGLGFTSRDAYAFSNWTGYLDPDNPKSGWAQANAAGARTLKLHTSGHASPADLSQFARAIRPAALVPVHGLAWNESSAYFRGLKRLSDGERWVIG
ncbi:ribonuclease J [Sphingomonas kaistensis]|uniref:Ribonuclease J n=1 Tax=Sphingomonas kaistensis TaxID=298708 RepID=A0A7X5Y631_9SPHN|nr:MBL fold metallo-hydrolase [Sphingomonas kaistensis]NJC05764.1 ribonuclease J [Sphingomonas kaistensis]